MSIFKKLSGKDDSKILRTKVDIVLDDIVSDELPPVEPASSPADLAKSIRAELEIEDDSDDIEDLVESAKISPRVNILEDDEFELHLETYAEEDHTSGTQWVEPYVDARGIPPVSMQSITPQDTAEVDALANFYDPLDNDTTEQSLSEAEDRMWEEAEDETADEDIFETGILALENPADEIAEEEEEEVATDLDAADTADDFEIAPVPRARGKNLSELRLDIVRITSDIDSGEALYRRAQQRVDSLIGFIEQAEVAVSTLQHMEPENRKLKSENHNLSTDVEAQRYKIARLETDLAEQREFAKDAHIKVDTLRAKLVEMNEALGESHNEVEMLAASNDELKIQAERLKTNCEIEARENVTLREKLTQFSENAERSTQTRLVLQKSIDGFANDMRAAQARNNALDTENSELRMSLRNAERQNIQMREELVEIQEKIVSFKAQHETHLHRRDDKIAALVARIVELQNAVKHKEDVIESTISDVALLRKLNTRHDIEREKLEKTIQTQSYSLNKAEDALQQSQHEKTELDHRYKGVAEALTLNGRNELKPRNTHPDIKPRPTLASLTTADDLSDFTSNPF